VKAPQYLLVVLLGCAACAWGLPAAHRLDFPRYLLPALLVLVGVALMMVGALLSVLPNFFWE